MEQSALRTWMWCSCDTGFTLSVYGWNCVRSLSSRILAGSISSLNISLSNFRCVPYEVFFKIPKFEILSSFVFCLVLTWDLIWINSMGNHGAVGYSQNEAIIIALVSYIYIDEQPVCSEQCDLPIKPLLFFVICYVVKNFPNHSLSNDWNYDNV